MSAPSVAPQAGTSRRKQLVRVCTFVSVGIVAACVHWGLAVGLVRWGAWRPLLSNALGWLIAFGLSFSGHRWLRWGDREPLIDQGLTRYLALSAIGFSVNELSYAALIHAGVARYDLGLAAILVVVAVLTFLAGRLWVRLKPPG